MLTKELTIQFQENLPERLENKTHSLRITPDVCTEGEAIWNNAYKEVMIYCIDCKLYDNQK